MPGEITVEVRMFHCKKYGVSMLADKADETCAKRFEISLDDKNFIHDFAKCRTCKRGAIMYELGKHKEKTEPKSTQGETTMATRTFKKQCPTHGEFVTTGPRGNCPQCKEAKDQAGNQGSREIQPEKKQAKGTALAQHSTAQHSTAQHL
jgi:hypothetical protein